MQKTFVIGDIHGAHSALIQCFERASFNPDSDRLICLGDICDRRIRVRECVDELLKVRSLVLILGNHDLWAREWMESGKAPDAWLMQGGEQTMFSYRNGIPENHLAFFRTAKYYHTENNRLFIHGGYNHHLPLEHQEREYFLWDRSLVTAAIRINDPLEKLGGFDDIFVGHTPTLRLPVTGISGEGAVRPVHVCNVWLMDTGAGWPGGRLSMMELGSGEVFQSDVLN